MVIITRDKENAVVLTACRWFGGETTFLSCTIVLKTAKEKTKKTHPIYIHGLFFNSLTWVIWKISLSSCIPARDIMMYLLRVAISLLLTRQYSSTTSQLSLGPLVSFLWPSLSFNIVSFILKRIIYKKKSLLWCIRLRYLLTIFKIVIDFRWSGPRVGVIYLHVCIIPEPIFLASIQDLFCTIRCYTSNQEIR